MWLHRRQAYFKTEIKFWDPNEEAQKLTCGEDDFLWATIILRWSRSLETVSVRFSWMAPWLGGRNNLPFLIWSVHTRVTFSTVGRSVSDFSWCESYNISEIFLKIIDVDNCGSRRSCFSIIVCVILLPSLSSCWCPSSHRCCPSFNCRAFFLRCRVNKGDQKSEYFWAVRLITEPTDSPDLHDFGCWHGWMSHLFQAMLQFCPTDRNNWLKTDLDFNCDAILLGKLLDLIRLVLSQVLETEAWGHERGKLGMITIIATVYSDRQEQFLRG